jgi:hypothetical protein
MTTRESRDCECGGRFRAVPDLTRRHQDTQKHKTWQFEKLCCEFLALTKFNEKVIKLKEMREIVKFV